MIHKNETHKNVILKNDPQKMRLTKRNETHKNETDTNDPQK